MQRALRTSRGFARVLSTSVSRLCPSAAARGALRISPTSSSLTPSVVRAPLGRFSSTSTTVRVPATKPTCVTTSQHLGDPSVYSFFEDTTSTWQYVVSDPSTNVAVIIDPVLDYNPASGQISTTTADGLLAFVEEKGLAVVMLLETHAHADHLTAAQYLKKRLGGVPVAIGKRIKVVQERFSKVYAVPKAMTEGAFDKLWEDNETFKIGELACQIVHLPGHTPDHVGYRCGKALFIGDTLFYPDVGSARADFPGGSPTDLYTSIERLLAMEPDVRLYTGHDYPPQGAGEVGERCWSLVSEQRERNVHLAAKLGKSLGEPAKSFKSQNATLGTEEEAKKAFIEWRANRDKSLGAPRLLHPSLQVNICAGRLPKADADGRRTLRVPLKVPAGL